MWRGSTGAALTFTPTDLGWRWTGLEVPGAPEGGWVLAEENAEVITLTDADILSRSWTLMEDTPERIVFEQNAVVTGVRLRRIFACGPAANVVRMETWALSSEKPQVLARLGLLLTRVEGETLRETGVAPASFPVLGERLFFGIEHVSGEASVGGKEWNVVRLTQRPRLPVGETWTKVATVVVGWAQPGIGTGLGGAAGLREAFLHYLDTVRLKPDRIVLHTDTWWSVPRPLSEARVLADIEALRKGFFDRTGMFFDTYCVDLGWSNPRSLWRMDLNRFPNELRPVQERLASLGAKLGLWLSPGGGYPDGLDNGWLQAQGYETLPFDAPLNQVPCFALGTRYQREFRERVVDYARQYELGHVILDFMPYRCDVAAHGHPVGPESRYAIDAGLADVMDGLRTVIPNLALEPMVCGYPPSPWWLMKTPFVLGPAGDDLPYGRGPCPDWIESLITARDVVYRASQESWIMPTQALETFDITMLTPGVFANMAVMTIGRGRWFLSTYFNTEVMKPDDWDLLAGLVRWARENRPYLINAWQFGGRPEAREAYGYMFRHADKDFYCVRNPWIEPRTIVLPATTHPTEARDVRTIYPRRAFAGRSEPGGESIVLQLAPYETVFLESGPAAEERPAVVPAPEPVPGFFAGVPRRMADPVAASSGEVHGMRYNWSGVLIAPAAEEAELCILVEGPLEISRSACRVTIDGREVKVQKLTSAGQFGAATDPSPDNWTWFIVSLAEGGGTCAIDLTMLVDSAQVGIFLRGTTPALNDAAPEGRAVFPTYKPTRRAWSQTLHPMRAFPLFGDQPGAADEPARDR